MAEEILFKPNELYTKELKDKFHNASEKYFDDLVAKSSINVEENRRHVADYNKKRAILDKYENQLSSAKGKRAVLITFSVVSIVIGIIFLYIGIVGIVSSPAVFIGVGAFLFVSGIAGIILSVIFLNKRVKSLKESTSSARQETEAAQKICWVDMVPLNAIYDWNMPSEIMRSATPIINLDKYFNNERLAYLVDKFGMPMPDDPDESVLGVLSGSIQGNPFVEQKLLKHHMGQKTYTGSLTITWTTTYSDSKGNVHTQVHTQTLVASLTKPAPIYSEVTILAYGNEAAPHLTFSRIPTKPHLLNEREREKTVAKEMKKLIKKSEKDIASGNGKAFTAMGNDEFDVFFGALDRNNEVEFRLLVTPLAQKNMVELIEDPFPFGDDFSMKKKYMMNYVCSAHSQGFDYLKHPANFFSYSVDLAKNLFVSYCDQFMQNLYFDLAPLLSIPLYQMHKPHEEIFKTRSTSLNQFEHEVLANAMPRAIFEPEGASPNLPLLIKETRVRTSDGVDNVSFHTFSYIEVPQTTYISKLGGDGYWHEVPVHWIRYDLVEKDNVASFAPVGGSRAEFNEKKLNGFFDDKFNPDNLYYERGLLAIYNDDNEINNKNDKYSLHSLFSKEK